MTSYISISIHALLAESDPTVPPPSTCLSNFYPRSPCGERPTTISLPGSVSSISIHALLAESDHLLPTRKTPQNWHFYPRSPCGERHKNECTNLAPKPFLSTLSLRRATQGNLLLTSATAISIHALLAESDTTQRAG